MNKLDEIKALSKKERKKVLQNMTEDEKLILVDAIIDRDAATWKEYNRRRIEGLDRAACDFNYYFRQIDGGLCLTERQR